MSLSLQNQAICDTYNQLIHTGSPNLTGNNIYTGNNTRIPLYITNTLFDFCENGNIVDSLTVVVPLTGVVYNNDNIIVPSSTTTCVFGKKHTAINSSQSVIFGGLSSCAIGNNFYHINTYNTFLSSSSASTIDGCTHHNLIGTHQSNIYVNTISNIVGGVNNCYRANRQVHAVGGVSNNLCSGGGIYIIGSTELTGDLATAATVNSVVVAAHKLSAYIANTAANGLFISGCGNYVKDLILDNHMFTGRNIKILDNLCKVHLYTGDDNLVYADCSTRRVDSHAMFTGRGNRMYAISYTAGRSTVFPFNGAYNILSANGTGIDTSSGNTIFNGLCNCLNMRVACGMILTGNNNIVVDCVSSMRGYLFTGYNNVLSGVVASTYNFMVNGRDNRLQPSSGSYYVNGRYHQCHGSIINGISGCNLQQSSIIFSGNNNSIGCQAHLNQLHTHIYNGISNRLDSTCFSLIFAGSGNSILSTTTNATQCSVILNGEDNTIISGATNTSILGGYKNIIEPSSASGSSIFGGRYNKVSHSDTKILGSNLSSIESQGTMINNLIITNLCVGCAGLPTGHWYRDDGSDIIKIV